MSQIVEIGFEIENDEDWNFLDELFRRLGIPHYVEPAGKFTSLEDLECQCEGK